MAVTRWSALALAEMRSVENGLPAATAGVIRIRARQIAAEAGRSQVEREDVRNAVADHFGGRDDSEEAE